MKDMFMEIHRKETNENTALILMLGVLSEKLTHIADLISKSNNLQNELDTNLKGENKNKKTKIIIFEPLTPEDYME